jgi:D-amino peptidase
MKIHISVDMEGIAGVVTGDQLSPSGFEYGRFREFMTAEANTAIQAAFEAGATDIVVADSHGNMQNLLVEKLPKNVTLVRGSGPRPLGMMQGIDDSFDAAMFIGYHASTTNTAGVRAHTISSASLTDVRVNGRSMPEAGLNAAVAGHFNVPVIMISGDDAIVAEAQGLLGNIEGAVVKWAYGFHAARTLTPEAANEVIRDKVRRAVARRAEFKP